MWGSWEGPRGDIFSAQVRLWKRPLTPSEKEKHVDTEF